MDGILIHLIMSLALNEADELGVCVQKMEDGG